MKGHWSRTCRTSKHLVDLYQESLKGKKKIETNFVSIDATIDQAHENNVQPEVDMTHLDVADFFISPEANIGHLYEDGNFQE